MDKDYIYINGLKENNIKNIDLTVPKGNIVVFTGVSGSGKSSVVFDTIAQESNRQMTLNYSQYVRNQMPRYERPNLDKIDNLSPVVVIEQKPIQTNARSTIASYMDLGPLLRLLFSRIGQPRIKEAIDFSSQSAFGKCPTCNGYGEVLVADEEKLVDFNKSLKEYAVQFKPLSPAGWQGRWMITGGLFDPNKKIKDFNEEEKALFLYGPTEGEKVFAPFHTKHGPQPHEWDGLLPRFTRLYINRDISKLKQVTEEEVLAMTSKSPCDICEGTGLNPKILASKINGMNIAQFESLELNALVDTLQMINDPLGKAITKQIIPQVKKLIDLNLAYVHLSRPVNTLSGGEAQRVKIARHLKSSLNNLIYIFDEPTAGLHPEEVPILIKMIKDLKAKHNTVLIVEHDEAMIQIADYVIEMGPGAGKDGGEIVYEGKPSGLRSSKAQTKLHPKLEIKEKVRKSTNYFTLKNVKENNLKNISLEIPKNIFVAICGVSGSGKSTLLLDAFLKKYPQSIWVSQSRIGISTRSTLATYMGLMDDIRQLMAKETGQKPGMFSFNSIGACPVCEGKGFTQPDLAFADPVTMTCEACHGKRYSQEALSYTYKGYSIADILNMTMVEAAQLFVKEKIQKQLQTLKEVGLDYLTIGQTTSTLSGGELQRLKLASKLQYKGQTYIFDEPSLGLHQKDSDKLLLLFDRLVEAGNSVIIIEHRLNFIVKSDWVIELGPTGGNSGGEIIFEGEPMNLLNKDTPTAKAIQKRLT